jgi:hypothetical protein
MVHGTRAFTCTLLIFFADEILIAYMFRLSALLVGLRLEIHQPRWDLVHARMVECIYARTAGQAVPEQCETRHLCNTQFVRRQGPTCRTGLGSSLVLARLLPPRCCPIHRCKPESVLHVFFFCQCLLSKRGSRVSVSNLRPRDKCYPSATTGGRREPATQPTKATLFRPPCTLSDFSSL